MDRRDLHGSSRDLAVGVTLCLPNGLFASLGTAEFRQFLGNALK
jgi:hypothetical protein